jgi:hypothetical protein
LRFEVEKREKKIGFFEVFSIFLDLL